MHAHSHACTHTLSCMHTTYECSHSHACTPLMHAHHSCMQTLSCTHTLLHAQLSCMHSHTLMHAHTLWQQHAPCIGTDVPSWGHNSPGVGRYLVDNNLTHWPGTQAPKKASTHAAWDSESRWAGAGAAPGTGLDPLFSHTLCPGVDDRLGATPGQGRVLSKLDWEHTLTRWN